MRSSPPGPALQAVMFDMDGLLVDTEPLWFEVEREVMARLGGTWSHVDQAALVGGSLAASVRYMLTRAAAAGGDPAGAAGPRRAPDPPTVAAWLVEGIVAAIAARGAPLLPGAAELLAEVAAAGVPCGLVTSSEHTVMAAVLASIGPDVAGVTGRAPAAVFRATVCAADVCRAKPDPEPYLLAASRLGADPARCVALEDAPNGVASAEAAGCVVVAVPGLAEVPPAPGRLLLSSLREVSVPMLADLVAARAASRG